MSLSSTDIDDVRRYAGYPIGPSLLFQDADMQGYSTMLDTILAGITDNQIAILRTRFLVPLRSLEAAILTASGNLDTDRAAVWFHNKNEVADRANLYMITRRNMCFFLGIPAGAGVSPLAPVAYTT